MQSDNNGTAGFGTTVLGDYLWVGARVFDPDGDASEVRPALVVRAVGIGIKASGEPNPQVCANAECLLPVAVLSSEDFATTLDADGVRFGRTGTEAAEVHVGSDGHAQRHVEDVNGDGLPDMVFHFRFSDTGFSCSDIPAGERSAIVRAALTGTAGNILVRGVDSLTLFAVPGR